MGRFLVSLWAALFLVGAVGLLWPSTRGASFHLGSVPFSYLFVLFLAGFILCYRWVKS